MKYQYIFTIVVIGFLFTAVHSCKEDSINITPRPVTLDLATIATSDPFFDLGRVLFYDTKLSVNNSISCSSCHSQALAFGDNRSFSPGFMNDPSLRNTLSIQNFSQGTFSLSSFFWDGRETDLSNLVLQPIFNHVEMGMDDMESLVDRVRNTPYYQELFLKAYHDQEITPAKISGALYQFVSTIGTPLSPRAFNSNLLSALELQGLNLFNGKYNCGSCHQVSFFGGTYEENFVNIGLDITYQDPGRFNLTGLNEDKGRFRIPSLVNVTLTAPYMHDGRFATLDDVLEHYSHGIKNHPNLDFRLKASAGQPIEMNITTQDKQALIAYLNAFTDARVIGNQLYSNPFRY